MYPLEYIESMIESVRRRLARDGQLGHVGIDIVPRSGPAKADIRARTISTPPTRPSGTA